MKCAVPGYGTKHEVLKGRKVIAQLGRSPSLILVGHFATITWMTTCTHTLPSWMDTCFKFRSLADVKAGDVREKSEAQPRMELHHWDRYGVPCEPPYPSLTRFKRFLNEHCIVYRIVQPVLEKLLRQSPLFVSLGAVLMDPPERSREESGISFIRLTAIRGWTGPGICTSRISRTCAGLPMKTVPHCFLS